MGIGKVLPTLVILIISAMMIFSILPAMAHDISGWMCPAEGKSPWEHRETLNPDEAAVDTNGNGNGFICANANGATLKIMDDHFVFR